MAAPDRIFSDRLSRRNDDIQNRRCTIIIIRYFAFVFALFIVFFEFLRALLLVRYFHLAAAVPWTTLIGSFLVGFRFDLAVTGYIVAPVALIGPLPKIGLTSSHLTRRLVNIYLVIMGAAAFLMSLIDLEFLGQFNTRLNHLALEWIDTPGFVMGMLVEWFGVIPLLIGWVLLIVLFAYALRYFTRRIFHETPRTSPSKSKIQNSKFKIQNHFSYLQFAIIYPLILGLTFLAIRGRVAIKAPLTWGVAYFSSYNFANQLALNSCFTFVRDAVIENSKRSRDAVLMRGIQPEDAYRSVRELMKIDSSERIDGYPIARMESNGTRLDHNVIVMLMESFTSEFVSSCGGSRDLAPEFDRMTDDGMLFRRFYSSGGHTFTGIFSTVTGLPSLPGRSLMKHAEGQQQYAGLATLLKGRGYHTRFYVPHDPHFDNMQGFLVANDFDHITGQPDYPAAEVVSSLGVPDEVMYNRIIEDLDAVREPFLVLLLTGSSHGPFVIPDRPFPRADPSDPEAERYDAFSYADWALGRFYEDIKAADWGRNTLLAILGDHGVIVDAHQEMDMALFHTPLLLIDRGVVPVGVSDVVGGQKDIVASVMDVLGGDWINNTLATSMFDSGRNSHALFVEGRATGLIYPPYYFYKDGRDRSMLYNLKDITLPFTDGEVSRMMDNKTTALLSTTYFMVQSRQVGLPSKAQN